MKIPCRKYEATRHERNFANKDSHGRRFQRYLSVLAVNVSQRKRLRDISA